MGSSYLHIACYFGKIEIVKLLLNHPDIDVNMKLSDGHTALMMSSDINIKKITFKSSRY